MATRMAGTYPMNGASENAVKAPSITDCPWAKLTIRITPKISVRPTATSA